MTFERAWVLLFLVVPPAFLFWQWRQAQSRVGATLKALTIACIVLAVAEPSLPVDETKVAVTALVDTSASIGRPDLQRAKDIVASLNGAKGRHSVQVIPFARGTQTLNKKGELTLTAGEAGRGTDLEAAIRDAVAALPSGMIGRVVLISDGQETEGSAVRSSALARQLRIPIDTFALSGRPAPLLRIDGVGIPSTVFTGEKFPITLSVSSPQATQASVELQAEGKQLGSSVVPLEAGSNTVRVQASLNVTGAVEISGTIKAAGLGEVRFDQAVTLRSPRVLFLSQDPAGTEAHLLDTLKSAKFDVQRSTDIGANFADYQLVVLNNWDLEAIAPARKEAVERYVRDGGGLLVIGGERNVYAENKKVEDALDRVLPAKLAPPRSPEGTCIVLIMDKSSSMEGRKMELARVSAVGLIDNIRSTDFIGVLIFDNSFQWAVPIRRAEDKSTIKRLIAGVMPDGGTQIAPALAEAYRRIQKSNATYRHILLLTDGISEEGDSISLSKEAATLKITISTVGLGQDVNRPYLEKVATNAKGRSYFLTDPSGLEQILIKDVLEHSGSTAIEKPIVPSVLKQTSVLDGVPIQAAPPLKGYVKFTSKPAADVVLTLDKTDPLLAVWQSGLGRAAVFTSDAKSRWAESWVGWEGFDRFWLNLFRDLLPHAQATESSLTYDAASGNLIAEYRLASHVPVPASVPDLFVFGPNGHRAPVDLKRIGTNAWRGVTPIGSRQGLFRVRPLEDSRLFPEAGLYRQEGELQRYGSDENLLRQISAYTGGRFNPSAEQVFDSGSRSIANSMALWPILLGLGVALNISELVLRKWRGLALRG